MKLEKKDISYLPFKAYSHQMCHCWHVKYIFNIKYGHTGGFVEEVTFAKLNIDRKNLEENNYYGL